MTNEQMKAILATIAANLQKLRDEEHIRDTGLNIFSDVQADVRTLLDAPAPPPVVAPPSVFEASVTEGLNNIISSLAGLDHSLHDVDDQVSRIEDKIDASETVLATIMHNTTAAT